MIDPIYIILLGVLAMILAMGALGGVMVYMTGLLKASKSIQEGIQHELHDGRLLAQHTTLGGAASAQHTAPIIIRITPVSDPDDTEPLLAIRSGQLAAARLRSGTASQPLSANQLPAQRSG